MRNQNSLFQHKKQVVLFVYDYACQLCGVVSLSNHCHHLDHNGSNHDAFNLLPLCVDCHILAHKVHLKIVPGPSLEQIKMLERLNIGP